MKKITKKDILILLDTQILGESWGEDYILEQIIYTMNLVRDKLCPFEVTYLFINHTLSARSEACIISALQRIRDFVEFPEEEKIDKLIRSMYHEINDAISDQNYREDAETNLNEQEKTCYFSYLTICLKILKCIEKNDYTNLYRVKEWYRLFIECYFQNFIDERYFPNVGSSFFL